MEIQRSLLVIIQIINNMNSGDAKNLRVQQNWHNFCQHHALGDWHGIWTFYSAKGEKIKSFPCIRSFRTNLDKTEIYHQNHYIYDSDRRETKTFGPYQPNTVRAQYLDNSFSWGSPKIKPNSSFCFETGFRDENQRASVVVTYNDEGFLDEIITIPEHLTSFVEPSSHLFAEVKSNSRQGVLKRIEPDLTTSAPELIEWNRLEDFQEHYLTLHFSERISISCPPQIEWEKENFFAVDWQATSATLYRGIRYYDSSGFKDFALQTFKE
jgi:hypothetical protein